MGIARTTPRVVSTTVPDVDTPYNMAYGASAVTGPVPVSEAHIMGLKANQTENVDDVWIGPSSTNGAQNIRIPPGGAYILRSVDLADWYVDVEAANDGVIVYYW